MKSDSIGMIYVAIISADVGHTDLLMGGLPPVKKRSKTSLSSAALLLPQFLSVRFATIILLAEKSLLARMGLKT